RETLDEAPAPDFATQLLEPVDPHQLPPGDRDSLALEQAAEHDAVARQELSRGELGLPLADFGLGSARERRLASRPAARVVPAAAESRPAPRGRERDAPHHPSATAGGRDEAAQPAERVAGAEPA